MLHRAHWMICMLLLTATVGCTTRYGPDESITLDTPGPFAVDVRTFNGDVIIRVDPDIDRARVRIVKAALHGAKRTDEAESSLSQIQTGVDLLPGDLGPVLQVRSSTTHAEPYFQRTHVYIDAAGVEDVLVHTQRGQVVVRGASGEVDISTTGGDVRFMTDLPLTQPILISVDEGDIDLRARGESTGVIDAQATLGVVSHRVDLGMLVVKPGTDTQTLRAVLNDGFNPINLRTTDGDIRFVIKANPTEVGMMIK